MKTVFFTASKKFSRMIRNLDASSFYHPTPPSPNGQACWRKQGVSLDAPSPWDLLAAYEMRLRSRGVRTLLEREANEVLEELRGIARDVKVPGDFVDDVANVASIGFSITGAERVLGVGLRQIRSKAAPYQTRVKFGEERELREVA